MTRTFLKALFALALPLAALCACSGNGGGGGISGSGITIGTITGFGSVIVNGIEFRRRADLPDSQARFRFDDSMRAEKELKVGMIVTVRGNFDSSTGEGEYESVEYHPEVRGPVDTAPGSVNTAARTLSVLGRTIRIDASTIFDGFGDLADLQPNNLVEVSGNLDDTGAFTATRIERRGISFIPGGVVELKGTISGAGANTFSIGQQVVNFDPALPGLFVDMTAADVAPATLVEVRGRLGTGGVITADRIEKQLATGDARPEDRVRIKGKVLSAGPATFQLSGPNGPLAVLTGDAVFVKGTAASLVPGARVEVEGALSDGALTASKISFEAVNIVKLEGNVSQAADVDPANGSIRLNGVNVSTGSQTRFRDNRTEPTGPSAAFGLNEIAPQDHLQIVGFVDASGRIIATQLQRLNARDRTFVQGRVGAAAAPNLTVLNLTVVTSVPGTVFKDAANNVLTRDAFFAALQPDATVVKASGTFVPPGTIDPASEVEIEQ